jgi:hypothetical protein
MENLTIAKKWMGAKEAYQSIETGKGFVCHDGKTLYVLAEVEASASGKQKFLARVDNGEEFEAYLEKLTRIVKGAAAVARETIKVEGEDSKKRQNANEYGTHKIVSLESIPSVSERVEQAKSRFAFLNEQIKKAKEELTRMQGRFHGEIEAVCAAEYEADVKRFKAAMEAKTRQNVNRSAKMYAKVLREYIAQYDAKVVAMLASDQQKAMVMALNKSERIERAQKAIAYFEGKVK